jgi:hypothetical protein
MKFILGLLTGLVLGAAGAVAYSVRSGRDLREAFEQVRSELEDRDLDALGARLEARFSEMQARLEERIGQARERATTATGDEPVEAGEATAETADEDQAGA